MWFQELSNDIRYGVRNLLRRPGFTAAAVLSLALGLATVTVMYSLLDAFLLRPLPVAHPEELVAIGRIYPGPKPMVSDGISGPNIEAFRARKDLFTGVIGTTLENVTIRLDTDAGGELATLSAANGDYFSILGISPGLGRFFNAADDERREPVVVLTEGYWKRHFNADRSALGRTIRVNEKPFLVIGVAPAGFTGTHPVLAPDLFTPIRTLRSLHPEGAPDERFDYGSAYVVMARRRAEVPFERIRVGLDMVARNLERDHPNENRGLRFIAYPEIRARPSIFIAAQVPFVASVFMALAVMVLVVACANVANLVLVRISARRNELGVRQALGASRSRVIRQLLTETVVLAIGGLALGWILARIGINWFAAFSIGGEFPIHIPVSPNWRVFAFAAGGAVVAGLAVGVFPAFSATRSSLRHAVREGTRASGGGARHRNVLVTIQLAVSLVAMVAAGLFTRSIQHAAEVDLGFKPERVLKTRLLPRLAGYDDKTAGPLFTRLLAEAAAIPGVAKAAWAQVIPLQSTDLATASVYVDSPSLPAGQDHFDPFTDCVSGDYFDAMGIGLLQGRSFTIRDDSSAPRVAIVNQAAAELYWPGRNPVGQVFRTAHDGPTVEVVGVAHDGKYLFVNETPRPFMYFPIEQGLTAGGRVLVLAARGDPAALVAEVRAAITRVDRGLVPLQMMTMTEHVRASITFLLLRLAGGIAVAIGILALIQAALGLYGVIAYSVALRSREIGIRMALGAEPSRVRALVVRQGGRLIALGLIIGVGVAMLASRALGGLLVGVGALDLFTFGSSVALLLGVAFLATYLPARRASRIDPIRAFKEDR